MQYKVSEPQQAAKFCIIWMHGLGAGCEDMVGLAQAINWPNQSTRHLFLQAEDQPVSINAGMRMPAWYDIFDIEFSKREDFPGVQQSSTQIETIISEQIASGIPPEKIFLAGFSQGGAMALYTGLRLSLQLGGLVALSAYIPCAQHLICQLNQQTPIFLGYGNFDPIVKPEWTRQSQAFLSQNGFKHLTIKSYPMEHAICSDELADIQQWFVTHLGGDDQ